ncbi:MAG: hypothetical protein MRERV_1c055 [Mycoplasmataceae bacterium RV_VA103A]|nr:MAG: hypothetical protein MRERV_10c056 [Mycoplasmataceae bacterium RV_VA103A]KLL05381.1 MAG: hypothetical protein MRERV_1c055 [Mycoplasmataceae bacterium RV_VA103A]
MNKLGHDYYFINNPKHGDYSYLDINFDSMINTRYHF